MKTPVLLVLVVASCSKPPMAASPSAKAEPPPDGCARGGWSSAIVVDGQFESGFEPTIAWNRVTGEPVLFDAGTVGPQQRMNTAPVRSRAPTNVEHSCEIR